MIVPDELGPRDVRRLIRNHVAVRVRRSDSTVTWGLPTAIVAKSWVSVEVSPGHGKLVRMAEFSTRNADIGHRLALPMALALLVTCSIIALVAWLLVTAVSANPGCQP